MKLRHVVVLLLFGWALCVPALANDTETGFEAGQPYPLKSTSLRLLREDLNISLEPSWAVVDVAFKLRNEGAARDVTLGFPYFATADKMYEDQNYAGQMDDFTCTVDGKPVPVSKSRGKSLDKSFKATSWYTWTVHFDAGQTRVVAQKYRGHLGSSVAASAPGVENASVRTFHYILTTAKNWKAPIGEFHLRVRPVAPVALSDIYAISMPGLVRVGDALEVTRTHFTPSHELRIQLFASFDRDKLKAPTAWVNPDFKVRHTPAPSSLYPPSTALAKALRAAVLTRYKIGENGMQMYTIVPYKDKFFASTVKNGKITHYALWEYVGGQWKFIFEHDEMKDAAADTLYGRNGFSPAMRERLMRGDSESF